MELFLFRHSEYERLYNCTGVVEQFEAQYPWETRTYPTLGYLIGILSTIYIGLYIPCMCSIWSRSAGSSCYTLMFYIGVCDLGLLCIMGLFQAYLSVRGLFFCNIPTLSYIVGAFDVFFFICECNGDVVLALDRCVHMISPNLARTLFDNKRIWIWIFVTTAYATYSFVFLPVAIYAPMYFAWVADPYTGLASDQPNLIYANPLVMWQDPITAFASPVLYFAFAIAFTIKIRKDRALVTSISNSTSTADSAPIDRQQIMIFLQVALISALNMMVGVLYTYLEHFPVPQTYIIVSQICWLHLHGLPPLIYLALNKNMRTDCMGYWKRIKKIMTAGGTDTAAPEPVAPTMYNSVTQHPVVPIHNNLG